MNYLPRAEFLFERLPRYFRRHRLMTGWMKLTGEDPVQLVRIRNDAFGYVDLSDGFRRLMVIEGDFEKDFFRLADALLEHGGEFLDIGANHGLLSFGLARKLDDRVSFHLFEPNSKLRESISKTLELYPSMRATINPEAVCDRNGTVHFYFDEVQSGISHIVEHDGTVVKALTLDNYIAEKKLNGVALLKIDIEGYELAALRGAENVLKTRRVDAIYFEYCEKWLSRVHPPRHLLEFLDSLSYEVCFCRVGDIAAHGVPTVTLKPGLSGHGLPLLPIRRYQVPSTTDLLAVPGENLTEL